MVPMLRYVLVDQDGGLQAGLAEWLGWWAHPGKEVPHGSMGPSSRGSKEQLGVSYIYIYLVGGVEQFIFSIYSEKLPNRLIFFRGVEITKQIWYIPFHLIYKDSDFQFPHVSALSAHDWWVCRRLGWSMVRYVVEMGHGPWGLLSMIHDIHECSTLIPGFDEVDVRAKESCKILYWISKHESSR